MISHRAAFWFTLFFWLSSMSWLGWTKLATGVQSSSLPQQDDLLPLQPAKVPPIGWRLSVDGRQVGWARQEMERLADGQGRVASEVHVNHLNLGEMLLRGIGPLGRLLGSRGLEPALAELPAAVDMTSEMHFDHFGQLQSFESAVAAEPWGECVRLQGIVREDMLLLQAFLLTDGALGTKEPIYQGKLPLPPDQLLVDSLAPRPRYQNLRAGQRWQFEAYNPLRPAAPLQSVEAIVTGKRRIRLQGQEVVTYHIRYQLTDDGGLSLSRDVGELWVATDGEVLRQTVRLGQLELTFERDDPQ